MSALRIIGIIAIASIGLWFFGSLLGFHINLVGTLLASIALTLIINAVMYGVRQIGS
jgi:hypothetical protein